MTGTAIPSEERQADPTEYPMPRATGRPFDPPPALEALREEQRITRVRLSDGSTPWLVTRYSDQRDLLADPRLSSDPTKPGYPAPGAANRPRSSLAFILMDDPEHARLRRMVAAPFTVKRIKALQPAVQKIVDDQIDSMLAGPKPADLVEEFALPVPSLVICELLGVPYTDHDFFQHNSKVVINRNSTPQQRSDALGELGDYLTRLVEEKLTTPGDDLLSQLTERIEAGELSAEEASEIGVLLLIAGHETTANMIALGTLALLQHPDQLALLRNTEDPELVASAVDELLRYLTITHNGRRRAVLEDIEIAGQTIRAGEGVIMPNDIGNRAPEVFPEPDRLDLTRAPRNHLAFGFGVHHCLGHALARMELQVVYSTLYRRIPTLQLATDLESIPFKHDGSVYGVHELPVTW